MEKGKVKVFVVDDSAFMRKFLSDLIAGDNELALAGTACDGEEALLQIKRCRPDVLTLDIDMPRLNGLDTLKIIMRENPLPVIILSSHTRKGSEITVEALAAGAVDFVAKPSLFSGQSIAELKSVLSLKIKEAAKARLYPGSFLEMPVDTGKTAFPIGSNRGKFLTSGKPARLIVAMGASTGGPRALEEVLRGLPAGLPAAFFITQHMPPGFTLSLSKRLDQVSFLKVREAGGGERILESEAYLAPGGYHLGATKGGTTILSNAAPVNHLRPSIDVMMHSLAEVFGAATLGVILTGMGRDGCDGMASIKEKGGRTIVQDPADALIPGMPKAVLDRGLADLVVPLEEMAGAISLLLGIKV